MMIRGKVKKYLPVALRKKLPAFLILSGSCIKDLSKKDRVQLAAILRSKTKWARGLRKEYA